MRQFLFAILMLGPFTVEASANCNRFFGDRAAPDAFSVWRGEVRRRPEITVRLPYRMNRLLRYRNLDLPLRLTSDPKARVHLVYFDTVSSIIPGERMMESYHAIIRYFEGYQYALSFASADDRRAYLAQRHPNTLSEGEWDDGARLRFIVLMNPDHFGDLSAQGQIAGYGPSALHYRPSRRRELLEGGLTSEHRTGSGLRYYFDAAGEVLGINRRGQVFALVKDERGQAAASHAAILKRQNPNLDLSRFRATVDDAFGLGLAEREIQNLESKLTSLDAALYPADEGLESLLRPLRDPERAKHGTNAYDLKRIVERRRDLLRRVGPLDPIAEDVTASFAEFCADASERRATRLMPFVYLTRLRPRDALLVSRRARVLHHQILRLHVGVEAHDHLVDRGEVVGGVLSAGYGYDGRLEDLTILAGTMRTRGQDRRDRTIQLSASERARIEMVLLNACRDDRR